MDTINLLEYCLERAKLKTTYVRKNLKIDKRVAWFKGDDMIFKC